MVSASMNNVGRSYYEDQPVTGNLLGKLRALTRDRTMGLKMIFILYVLLGVEG